MRFAIFLYLFVAAVLCESWAHSDSELNVSVLSGTFKATNRTCTEIGYSCSSCSELSLCIDTEEGLFEFTDGCPTDSGLYCSPSRKTCSNKDSYCLLGGQFECRDTGFFPDPYDCNVYYYCRLNANGQLETHKVMCPTGKAFNAKSYNCDLKDTDRICDSYPVPKCPQYGLTAAALPENPNIYYVCQKGVHQFFRCPSGDFYFDPEKFACVQAEHLFGCTPGENVAVPNTCNYFFDCANLPTPSHDYCRLNGYYFNRQSRSCSAGDCPYNVDWSLACATDENQPVLGLCNLYYNCSATIGYQVVSCYDNYYDRETKSCGKGKCPYYFY